MSKRCSAVVREIHRTISHELQTLRREAGRSLSLLDVGCWDGTTTAEFATILGGGAAGVEVYPAEAAAARTRGIDVAQLDLETQRLPWDDESFDVVIANQVFEHLKNVWHPMSELARLVKPGGSLVFSVPNLASFHNRVMLALGWQPSSIRTFGPHVRGFTFRQARDFVSYGRFFDVTRAVGVGFYPIPASGASLVARAWVGASHTPVFLARRRAPAGTPPPWAALANDQFGEQTFYAPAAEGGGLPG
jgi:SAM-dependent methyltransferase